MRNITLKFVVLAMSLSMVGAWGAKDEAKANGHFDVSDIKELSGVEPTVALNIPGPLLRMMSGVVAGVSDKIPDIEEIAPLIPQLELVKITVYEDLDSSRHNYIKAIEAQTAKLKKAGWISIIRVPDDEELVEFLMLMKGDNIGGILGFVVESEELVVINIIGEIDPMVFGTVIGSLGSKFIDGELDLGAFAAMMGGEEEAPQAPANLFDVDGDGEADSFPVIAEGDVPEVDKDDEH